MLSPSLQEQVRQLKTRFKIGSAELKVSDKASSNKGFFQGQPAFVKILTDDDPKWVNRFVAEVNIYRHLQNSPHSQIFEIMPKMLDSNIEIAPFYLVMEWKDAAVNYSPMRWAEKEVGIDIAVKMGEILSKLNTTLRTVTSDLGLKTIIHGELHQKMADYLNEMPDSYLGDKFKRAIVSKLPPWLDIFSNSPKQIIHGDPLFTNFMSASDRLYLIDYEYAVISHPAHDLASFWVTSSLAPKSRLLALNRYRSLYSSWTADFERVLQLFKARYALRELSQLHQSRGYHITFTEEGKQQIIADQFVTLQSVLELG